MLGSFYEKAWDFERQAQAQRHIDTPSSPEFSPSKRRRRSSSARIHLPKDEFLQLGNGRAPPVGSVNSKKSGPVMEDLAESSTDANEVLFRTNNEQGGEVIIEAIVASWLLLLYRYQRDTFQRFSWGVGDSEGVRLECVPIAQTDFAKVCTLADLIAAVRRTGAVEAIARNSNTHRLILNDGSSDEVSPLGIAQDP